MKFNQALFNSRMVIRPYRKLQIIFFNNHVIINIILHAVNRL